MIETLNLRRQHAALRDEIAEALLRVVHSGRYILGDEVTAFERDFAAAHGVRHGVGVNSGTDALRITLRALGVRAGDEVVTTANTFVATVGAVVELGAIPRFVDVADDENLDPHALAVAITPRTRAVIAVHLRGLPADMAAVRAVCDAAGVAVVEDAAQAAGGLTAAGPVGSLGDAGCFSLHPQKNLGAIGDAGVITTSDDAVAERCRMLRNHGLRTRDQVDVFGYNSRLDPLQAAILSLKLRHLPEWTRRRRQIAGYYGDTWRDLPLVLPRERVGDTGVYHHYVVRTPRREGLRAHLAAAGIDALVHYPVPIHRQPAFATLPGASPGRSLPNTERQAAEILSVPAHCWLTDAEVEVVAGAVRSYFRQPTAR